MGVAPFTKSLANTGAVDGDSSGDLKPEVGDEVESIGGFASHTLFGQGRNEGAVVQSAASMLLEDLTKVEGNGKTTLSLRRRGKPDPREAALAYIPPTDGEQLVRVTYHQPGW